MIRSPALFGSSHTSAGSPGSLSTPASIHSVDVGRGPTLPQAVCLLLRGEDPSSKLAENKFGFHTY